MRLWTRVDSFRYSKRGGEREKNWMRSFSLAATDASSFALSYICEIRFCPRLLFIAVAIDVNLAPIKAVAHVRGSVRGDLTDEHANLHRPYCCALKSQSKFYVDPLCDWSTILRVRESTMRPDNRFQNHRDLDPTRTSLPIAGSYYRFHAPTCHPNCMRSNE